MLPQGASEGSLQQAGSTDVVQELTLLDCVRLGHLTLALTLMRDGGVDALYAVLLSLMILAVLQR